MSNTHFTKYHLNRNNLSTKISSLFLLCTNFHIQAMEERAIEEQEQAREETLNNIVDNMESNWYNYFNKTENQLLAAIEAGEFPESITHILNMREGIVVEEAEDIDEEAYERLLNAIIKKCKNLHYISGLDREIPPEIVSTFLITAFQAISKAILRNCGSYKSNFVTQLAEHVVTQVTSTTKFTEEQKREAIQVVITTYLEFLVRISKQLERAIDEKEAIKIKIILIRKTNPQRFKYMDESHLNSLRQHCDAEDQYTEEYRSFLDSLSEIFYMTMQKQNLENITQLTLRYDFGRKRIKEISQLMVNRMKYSNSSLLLYVHCFKDFLYNYAHQEISFLNTKQTEQHFHEVIDVFNEQYTKVLEIIIDRINYLKKYVNHDNRLKVQMTEQQLEQAILECGQLLVGYDNDSPFDRRRGLVNILTFVYNRKKLTDKMYSTLMSQIFTNAKEKILKISGKKGEEIFHRIIDSVIEECAKSWQYWGLKICTSTTIEQIRRLKYFESFPEQGYLWAILNIDTQDGKFAKKMFEKISEAIITNINMEKTNNPNSQKGIMNLLVYTDLFSNFCYGSMINVVYKYTEGQWSKMIDVLTEENIKVLNVLITRNKTYETEDQLSDMIDVITSKYLRVLDFLATSILSTSNNKKYEALKCGLRHVLSYIENTTELSTMLVKSISQEINTAIAEADERMQQLFELEAKQTIQEIEMTQAEEQEETRETTSETKPHIKKA